MILAVDIGNTNIKLGIFHYGGYDKLRVDSSESGLKKIEEAIVDIQFGGAIVSSVSPAMTAPILSIIAHKVEREPIVVSCKSDTGLSFSVTNPERVGADRIVAAAYAFNHFQGPAAVVDFGTITAISVVGNGAAFMGGALLPGVRMMARAMNEHTALLPLVEIIPEVQPLGNNTEGAIASGVVIGSAGAVDRIIKDIGERLARDLKVAVTGGNSGVVGRYLSRCDLNDQDLNLKGLKYLYDRMVL
ncbi:MAG: type III pantothenate kinase [Nitrospirae bacterium]|nr:type III pantothenate kinase [Nitrospirota bacterium]